MTLTFAIIGIFLGLVVVVFQLLWMMFLIHSALRGTDILTTPRRSIPMIIDLLQQHSADTTMIYDIGCGKGGVTRALKRAFPDAGVVGIDDDRIQIFAARIQSFFFRQSITFTRTDVFAHSLANATCIFAYIPLAIMQEIGPKLHRELKPGAIVVTNAKQFPQWSPIATTGKFFVYKR
ncbi:hypothetical protein HY624_04380 [Candidatus Uhrbacteria bacterium]|nr:hypothetical protein [Candidatus Uhrbacteria bacterium]